MSAALAAMHQVQANIDKEFLEGKMTLEENKRQSDLIDQVIDTYFTNLENEV